MVWGLRVIWLIYKTNLAAVCGKEERIGKNITKAIYIDNEVILYKALNVTECPYSLVLYLQIVLIVSAIYANPRHHPMIRMKTTKCSTNLVDKNRTFSKTKQNVSLNKNYVFKGLARVFANPGTA